MELVGHRGRPQERRSINVPYPINMEAIIAYKHALRNDVFDSGATERIVWAEVTSPSARYTIAQKMNPPGASAMSV